MRPKTTILMILILVILISEGCVTRKKCLSKFPPATESTRIEKTRDSIVYRDRIVPVTIPGKVVRDSVPIPCPEFTPQPTQGGAKSRPDTAFAETPLAWAKAWPERSMIKLLLVQKDTTLQLRLDSAIKEAWHWKSEYESSKITEQVKYIPGVFKVAFWLWIFVIIVVAGFLVLKYKTGLFNTNK